MEKEKVSSGNIIDWRVVKRILEFVQPYKGRFYAIILFTVLLGALGISRPILIHYTLDNDVANGNYMGMVYVMLIMLGLIAVQSVIQYGHTYLSGRIGQFVISDIRIKLYKHLVNHRLKFFDKTPIGRLVTRAISDVESLADVFSEGLAAMAGDLLQIVFILGAMFYIDWRLALVSLGCTPLMFIATYIFKEKVKVAFNEVRNAVANLNTFVQEHITGMNVVQIFGSEKREFEKFKDINKEHRHAHLKSVLYYSVYFPVAEIISAMCVGFLIWYGAKGALRFEETGIKIGTLTAFIMYIQMFFRPIRMLAERYNTLQMGIVSTSRIINLLDSQEHIATGGQFIPEKIEGQVEFNQVWFAYNDENYVLKDVSLSIKSGETIAIVGATGAGKSSIANLLNRFYDINKGEIKIDNKNINEFELGSLRKNIGVVLQDVFLFSDTIRNNITLNNPDVTDAMIEHAAELVGAKRFIDKLPGGWSYNVMERGSTLSVGQRQLLSFIRAMVYDPKILVLDEATSSVDHETEEMIQEAIDHMMQGRTAIVIAHRLSTIQKADKIIVLDKGEIKESGTHEELLNHNGFYAQLYQMQFKVAV